MSFGRWVIKDDGLTSGADLEFGALCLRGLCRSSFPEVLGCGVLLGVGMSAGTPLGRSVDAGALLSELGL